MPELTLADLRKMGGEATKKKYGAEHYREMNRRSQETKRKKKLAQSSN